VCGWLEEKVPKEVADYSGRGAERLQQLAIEMETVNKREERDSVEQCSQID
jgi:hypothetical protein